ncbi:hypothetical protein CHUAL_000985 [Chamberlinius hualienensis]
MSDQPNEPDESKSPKKTDKLNSPNKSPTKVTGHDSIERPLVVLPKSSIQVPGSSQTRPLGVQGTSPEASGSIKVPGSSQTRPLGVQGTSPEASGSIQVPGSSKTRPLGFRETGTETVPTSDASNKDRNWTIAKLKLFVDNGQFTTAGLDEPEDPEAEKDDVPNPGILLGYSADNVTKQLRNEVAQLLKYKKIDCLVLSVKAVEHDLRNALETQTKFDSWIVQQIIILNEVSHLEIIWNSTSVMYKFAESLQENEESVLYLAFKIDPINVYGLFISTEKDVGDPRRPLISFPFLKVSADPSEFFPMSVNYIFKSDNAQ